MPAEWSAHDATWVAWPHETSDWPGKIDTIHWVYAEIVRELALSERVEIIVRDEDQRGFVSDCLKKNEVLLEQCRLHVVPTDRSWLRDSGPTAVYDKTGALTWMQWNFNAWARYANYQSDQRVPSAIAQTSGANLIRAVRPDDSSRPLVLEGGAIDVDGEGTLLATEECLLSAVQERNPGLTRAGYEEAFFKYLGVSKTIWLASGIEGDDTHGHIDDVARFAAPGKVLLAYEDAETEQGYAASQDNYQRLIHASDAAGRPLEVVKLPLPRKIVFDSQVLPASYLNFYIANRTVLVPTFNDEKDRQALQIIADLFPGRRIVGIHSVDLVLGFGTIHCLTQQQPAV